jgi:hypothetical protein
MKKCSYCGRENDDAAVRCKECGTCFNIPISEPLPLKLKRTLLTFKRQLLVFSGTYPQGFERRSPIFGSLAVSAPLIGFVAAAVINSRTDFDGGDMRGLAELCQFAAIVLLALLLGGISALVGLSRGEKYRALSYVGLAVDFGPVLLLFLNRLLRSVGAPP